MSEDAANVINGWGKVLPILINGVKALKSNYIGFKEKGLVWSTVAGVIINTTTLETNLTTEMTSSSAKNVSENTKND
jgi:hypothetical protein